MHSVDIIAMRKKWDRDIERAVAKAGCKLYGLPNPFARQEREEAQREQMCEHLGLSDDALAILAGEDPTVAQ